MQAIVVADGEPGSRAALDAAWPGWCGPDPWVIAADGGAAHAAALGLPIHRWVGDADSVDPALLADLAVAGVPIDRVPVAKDASDTELAVLTALEHGATQVVILGALGGPRFDHALANIALLRLPELDGIPAAILDAAARVRIVGNRLGGLDGAADGPPARLDLDGRIGDLVTLLPVGDDAAGVTTTGLEFPLRDEPLAAGHSRGLSNVRRLPRATVTVRRGLLLVVETPATL